MGSVRIAGDLLGLKSTSDVFVGILEQPHSAGRAHSEIRLEETISGSGAWKMPERIWLVARTISVDRKSQIITITVTDWSPQIAADMAQAYVDN